MKIRPRLVLVLFFLADVCLLTIFGLQRRENDIIYRQVSVQMHEDNDVMAETKKIALTFDDGPNHLYTMPLLEGLHERGVKATFFLLGQEVTEYPEIAKKIAEEGHLIGNHSFYHNNLCELKREDAVMQVGRTNEVIYEATGQYPQLIRPPFGSSPDNLVYEPPMVEVLWTIDSRDWALSDVGTIMQNVLPEAKEDAIILMHDSSKTSVQAALAIVDSLQKEGYTFVTLDEILFD